MKQRNEQEMHKLYKAWQESGQSKKEFALGHNLRPNTFHYWIKKFENPSTCTHPTVGFEALSVGGTPIDQRSPLVVIHYPSGVSLELHTFVEASFLKALTD